MKYVIYDLTNGDGFEEILEAKTEDEAIAIFEAKWAHLSDHDKKDRISFDLALVELDEDGIAPADYSPIRSMI